MTMLEDYESRMVEILRRPQILPADQVALEEISRWARAESSRLAARGSRSERLESIGKAFVAGRMDAGVLPDDISARVCGRVFRR